MYIALIEPNNKKLNKLKLKKSKLFSGLSRFLDFIIKLISYIHIFLYKNIKMIYILKVIYSIM